MAENQNGPEQQSSDSKSELKDSSQNDHDTKSGSDIISQAGQEASADEADTNLLDQILKEEDPEFSESLNKIKEDQNLAKAEIADHEPDAIVFEKEYWRNSKGLKKVLYYLIPFLPYISLSSKRAYLKLLLFLSQIKDRFINFLHYLAFDFRKKLVEILKDTATALAHFLSSQKDSFIKLNKKDKLIVVSFFIFASALSVVIYKSVTTGIIPHDREPYIHSLEEKATEVTRYNSETEVEDFLESYRVSKNIVEIPKLVVNLRAVIPDTNPMVAFDLYIEGSTKEVIIEIRDRMPEMKDHIQRSVEDLTFDQIISVDGKTRFRDRIKSVLNTYLTTGQVRKVLLKTFVTKPM